MIGFATSMKCIYKEFYKLCSSQRLFSIKVGGFVTLSMLGKKTVFIPRIVGSGIVTFKISQVFNHGND